MSEQKKLTRRTAGFSLAGVAVLAVLLLWFAWGRPEKSPGELLDAAWKNTVVQESFGFYTRARMFVGERQEAISELKGRKNSKGLHAKGTILNTPVEVYLIENRTYIKDPYGTWFTLEDKDTKRKDLLLAEINPLLYLSFEDKGTISRLGEEVASGRESIKLSLQPKVDNQYLNMLYYDFKVTVWVDKEDEVLNKVVLEGVSKKNSIDRINIEVGFHEYGEEFMLEPPIQKVR